jgi:hypothetical protein
MELERIGHEFYLRVRSVEGRGWQRCFPSSLTAICIARELGMELPSDAQWRLDHGSSMPGWPRGFGDYTAKINDAKLAACDLEMVGEWKATSANSPVCSICR